MPLYTAMKGSGVGSGTKESHSANSESIQSALCTVATHGNLAMTVLSLNPPEDSHLLFGLKLSTVHLNHWPLSLLIFQAWTLREKNQTVLFKFTHMHEKVYMCRLLSHWLDK